MKLTKSLFLAFAGLGLFACSNEEVTTDATVDGGKSKTMVISLNGISEGSRAISAAEEEGKVALNKVAIFYTTTAGNVGHNLSSPYQTAGLNYSSSVSYNDKVKNIYDLEGNVRTWTTEAYSTYLRVYRGRLLRLQTFSKLSHRQRSEQYQRLWRF